MAGTEGGGGERGRERAPAKLVQLDQLCWTNFGGDVRTAGPTTTQVGRQLVPMTTSLSTLSSLFHCTFSTSSRLLIPSSNSLEPPRPSPSSHRTRLELRSQLRTSKAASNFEALLRTSPSLLRTAHPLQGTSNQFETSRLWHWAPTVRLPLNVRNCKQATVD